LRGLARSAAKAAAVDEERLAVGCDEQQRVALTHVDGFHQQRVAGVVDGPREDCGNRGQKQRGPGGEP